MSEDKDELEISDDMTLDVSDEDAGDEALLDDPDIDASAELTAGPSREDIDLEIEEELDAIDDEDFEDEPRPKKKSGGMMKFILILAVIGGGGWYGYTQLGGKLPIDLATVTGGALKGQPPPAQPVPQPDISVQTIENPSSIQEPAASAEDGSGEIADIEAELLAETGANVSVIPVDEEDIPEDMFDITEADEGDFIGNADTMAGSDSSDEMDFAVMVEEDPPALQIPESPVMPAKPEQSGNQDQVKSEDMTRAVDTSMVEEQQQIDTADAQPQNMQNMDAESIKKMNEDVMNMLEQVTGQLDILHGRFDDMEGKLSRLEDKTARQPTREDLAGLKQSFSGLETKLSSLETQQKKIRFLAEKSLKKDPPPPEWTLQSAVEGRAWVAQKGGADLVEIQTGETLEGAGQIQEISRDNQGWFVRGEKKTIRP